MKKKGFTLIELLAVIVILAIIALIALPIIMNTIEDSKKGAAERGADNYLDAVETAVATEKLEGTPMTDGTYVIDENGNLCKQGVNCTTKPDKLIKVEMSGNKPTEGTIVIENGVVVAKNSNATAETELMIGDYEVKYDENNILVAALPVLIESFDVSWDNCIDSSKSSNNYNYGCEPTITIAPENATNKNLVFEFEPVSWRNNNKSSIDRCFGHNDITGAITQIADCGGTTTGTVTYNVKITTTDGSNLSNEKQLIFKAGYWLPGLY